MSRAQLWKKLPKAQASGKFESPPWKVLIPLTRGAIFFPGLGKERVMKIQGSSPSGVRFCLMLQRRVADHALVYHGRSKRARELGNQLAEACRAGDIALGEKILDTARTELGK